MRVKVSKRSVSGMLAAIFVSILGLVIFLILFNIILFLIPLILLLLLFAYFFTLIGKFKKGKGKDEDTIDVSFSVKEEK